MSVKPFIPSSRPPAVLARAEGIAYVPPLNFFISLALSVTCSVISLI